MMEYDPEKHHRRSIRLKGYDYTKAGAYFVTICAYQRECLFGDFIDGSIKLNDYGNIVKHVWNELPKHYPNVSLDSFVIMPNHVHGIIMLKPVDEAVGEGLQPALKFEKEINQADTPKPEAFGNRAGYKPAPTCDVIHGLPEIVRGFKTFSAKKINIFRDIRGVPVWQRNYYEHIIRNEIELDEIRKYIEMNPVNWLNDIDNPGNIK